MRLGGIKQKKINVFFITIDSARAIKSEALANYPYNPLQNRIMLNAKATRTAKKKSNTSN